MNDFVGIKLITPVQKESKRCAAVLTDETAPHRVALARWPNRVSVLLPVARDVGDSDVP